MIERRFLRAGEDRLRPPGSELVQEHRPVCRIELRQDVVQQEHRCVTGHVRDDVSFGKLHCEHTEPLLAA